MLGWFPVSLYCLVGSRFLQRSRRRLAAASPAGNRSWRRVPVPGALRCLMPASADTDSGDILGLNLSHKRLPALRDSTPEKPIARSVPLLVSKARNHDLTRCKAMRCVRKAKPSLLSYVLSLNHLMQGRRPRVCRCVDNIHTTRPARHDTNLSAALKSQSA
ncbi:hypothetical protein EJB05_17955, partial [Eragrostis curvula]